MWPNPQFAADLVTSTDNGKPYFLCSVDWNISLKTISGAGS